VENVPIVLPTMVDVYASNCINVSYIPAKIELVVITLNSCCKSNNEVLSAIIDDVLELMLRKVVVENAEKLAISAEVEIA
jgi:hypothetical protein